MRLRTALPDKLKIYLERWYRQSKILRSVKTICHSKYSNTRDDLEFLLWISVTDTMIMCARLLKVHV